MSAILWTGDNVCTVSKCGLIAAEMDEIVFRTFTTRSSLDRCHQQLLHVTILCAHDRICDEHWQKRIGQIKSYI